MSEIPWIDIFIIVFIGMGPIKVLLVFIGATRGRTQRYGVAWRRKRS